MAMGTGIKNIGLRGVVVADTAISYIDGQKGILLYRGYRIEELAGKSSFEENAYLLLNGRLPTTVQFSGFMDELAGSRELPVFIMEAFRKWPKESDPMDVLQASISLLAMADSELRDDTKEAGILQALRIISRMPSVIAAWHRIREGYEPLPPDRSLSRAADFLRQLSGRQPGGEMSRDLDVSLILHAEHTFNASTFACRETVSTGAHMYAGVAAGVGALSGRLHGGANARVLRMLLEMEREGRREEEIAEWVRERLDRGERIMGMGHPVYKTFDPRSAILKRIAARLSRETGHERLYGLLSRIEEECIREFERRGKSGIKANVDYYSGLVYWMMGVPVDLMTPLFAMAIVVGWCAHILEEKFGEAGGEARPYGPQAEYIGRYCGERGCSYQPIDER